LDGRVIGGVRLYITDKSARVAGIGYNFGAAFWNRGYATEAASAALDHAFSAVGLRRVRAEADARNHSSIRVMQKLGMTEEPAAREQREYRGELVEVVTFSINAEAWPHRKGG
jgi:RimJ/RimL family protein N-acetyltransferase